jgi:hypothetical protein
MDLVTRRITRPFLGEKQLREAKVVGALHERAERSSSLESFTLPEHKTSRWSVAPRSNRKKVEVSSYAPQLIRLVRHPYALDTVRARRHAYVDTTTRRDPVEPLPHLMKIVADEKLKVEPKSPVGERVHLTFAHRPWKLTMSTERE